MVFSRDGEDIVPSEKSDLFRFGELYGGLVGVGSCMVGIDILVVRESRITDGE